MEDRGKRELQFYRILEEKLIYPVYQPIVSLENGEVIGYEALSRIDLDECEMNPEKENTSGRDEGKVLL